MIAGSIGQRLGFQMIDNACVVPKETRRIVRFALGLGKRLAMLVRDDATEFRSMLGDQIGEFAEPLLSLLDRCWNRQRLRRRINRASRLRSSHHGDDGDGLAGRRIDHRHRFLRIRRAPLPINVTVS